LGGASLTSSNSFGTNGNSFPSIVYHTSANVYPTAATVTVANNSSNVTATGNLFAGWPRYGVSFAQGGNQLFVRSTNGPNAITSTLNISPGYTNASVNVYFPELTGYDINGNQQWFIGAGGMFGTATGNLTQGTADGGVYFMDGNLSTHIANSNPGGGFGELLGFQLDFNNGGPAFSTSDTAPSFSFILEASGRGDFRNGLENDQGQLVLNNPTLSGTVAFPNQSSNTFLAGPKTNGASAGPTFRLMDKSDLVAGGIMQAGFTNLSAAASAIIQFKVNMPDTNFTVVLQGDSAALLSGAVTAQTVSNFTTSMTAFTGNLGWIAIERTQ
jgi:hypothetical protein